MVDYHTHTYLCKHADGKLEDYIISAINKGLLEFGCSEHMPFPDNFDAEHRMSIEQFNSIYKTWFEEAREKFSKRINLRFGIEADFIPGKIDKVKNFIEGENFDYVIGSIHFLEDWNIASTRQAYRYEREDINNVYERYYNTMNKLVGSGIFDIVGHFDLVKKFGYKPDKTFDDVIFEILKQVKRNNLCIEINTSGLRQKAGEPYPSMRILKMASDLKIPLTLGSDAHNPFDVGRDFNIAYEIISKFGEGRITVFEKREMKQVKFKK